MKVVIAKVNEVLFDGEAVALTVPGSEGEMTVLSHHEPLITTLRRGEISVHLTDEANSRQFSVDGGILEVRPDGATVIL